MIFVRNGVRLGSCAVELTLRISASNPATFLGVSALVTLVVLVANFLPARKAAKIDPIVTLRYE